MVDDIAKRDAFIIHDHERGRLFRDDVNHIGRPESLHSSRRPIRCSQRDTPQRGIETTRCRPAIFHSRLS